MAQLDGHLLVKDRLELGPPPLGLADRGGRQARDLLLHQQQQVVSYADENGDLVEGQPSKQPQSVMVVFLAGAKSEELVVADSRSHDSDICGPGLR